MFCDSNVFFYSKALLRKKTSCLYKNRVSSLASHESLNPGGIHDVWDIEDFVTLGQELKGFFS